MEINFFRVFKFFYSIICLLIFVKKTNGQLKKNGEK